MALTIEEHGIVGDMRTGALVGLSGEIDFLCWPRFGSPSIFAKLLDEERGGAFSLMADLAYPHHRQLYLPDTNILLTRFLAADGVAEISDFMAIDDPDCGQRLVRRAKAIRKSIRFTMRCEPRLDYARVVPEVTAVADGARFVGAGLKLRLRASVPITIEPGAAVASFVLHPGDSASFILESEHDSESGVCDQESYVADAFKRTSDYWRHWIAQSTYRGRWRAEVNRSALALKLLTSAEHGSMVAALTFGLPETLGGERNWDYRYTWLRDSAFTVYAFLRLGFTEEANAFVRWLAERMDPNGSGELQLMYGVDGHTQLTESELNHLSGYADSRPVRIGNGASHQLQLDVYGELMDAIYLADKYGEQLSADAWVGLRHSINWLADNWRQPDESIWEVRSGRQHFLHTRVMCWVAFDRALRYAAKRAVPAPIERWRQERDAVYEDIYHNFWNAKRGAFVQYPGSSAVDAASLLMPLVRFISPTDPKWISTLTAIEQDLLDDSLVYRYSHDSDDGLEGIEGTFNMCSFWYVECLARAGDLPQARFLFEKMLGYANHLGLFAEETGAAGEQLGNFPQAFTHLALISAAFYLDRQLHD